MRILFVGDVMLGRDVLRVNAERGGGWIWEEWRKCGLSFDAVIGNLECVLTEHGCANSESASTFRAPERLIEGSCFSALSLANNHVRDFGDVGIADTVDALRRQSIQPLGVGRSELEALKPYVAVGKDGTKVAVVVGTAMGNVIGRRGEWHVASIESMIEHCARITHDADLRVAFAHMGYERVEAVGPEARAYAKRLIRAGYDLVIGHHPHVIQGAEVVGGKLVFYSLGDFVFDSKDPTRKHSLGVEVAVAERSLKHALVHAFSKTVDLRPCVADVESAAEILRRVESLSAELEADKGSDRFFHEASGDYLGRQWRDVVRVVGRGGLLGLLTKKLRRVRLIHLRLLLRASCRFVGRR
jgi:poly-gamma-glutamate capsule biosynthesis protein CapA/YwtB (metallophosphatase superfamily)